MGERGREKRERRGEMMEREGAEHQKRAVSGVLLVFKGMEGAEHQKRAIPGAFVVFKGRGILDITNLPCLGG